MNAGKLIGFDDKMKGKLRESIAAVVPIVVIVLVLSATIAPMSTGPIVLFLLGAVMLILGMTLFTRGVDVSMIPMGEGIGVKLASSKNKLIPMALCFALGVLITIAEPDLTVLANQITSIPNLVIIVSVAVGVGLFLVFALCRTAFKIPLSYILIFFYAVAFVLAAFTPDEFLAAAFDAGGVTTGPITVPFLMAFGIGLASTKKGNASSESFGMIAMCSIGPIISTMILGMIYSQVDISASSAAVPSVETMQDALMYFVAELPAYFKEVAVALAPIAVLFALFQLVTRRFKKKKILRIIAGFIYTYVGLALFLTGVNVGFMPVGTLLGTLIASSELKWLLIPIGMLVGYFIVAAEPAVHVLKKQVEEVSGGGITARAIGIALSIGVSASVGIAMLRVLTGISILWFLVPGYAIALLLSLFVPQMFTGVAFDAGGVASGPMTATFLLPLAMGACSALGGNVMTDAFGMVAMVAMTPLLTIQLLGAWARVKKKRRERAFDARLDGEAEAMIYYD